MATSLQKTVLWISDLHTSGYSRVALHLIPVLKKVFDRVVCVAINNSAKSLPFLKRNITRLNLHTSDVSVVAPSKQVFKQLGLQEIQSILSETPSIRYIFILNDMQYAMQQKEAVDSTNFKGKIFAYIPVDARQYPRTFFKPLRTFDAVFTMTPNSAHEIQKSIGSQVYVLPHAVYEAKKESVVWERTKRAETRRELGLEPDTVCFMTISVQNNRKRLDLLVESFQKLCASKSHVNVHLVIKLNGVLQKNSLLFNKLKTLSKAVLKKISLIQHNIEVIDNLYRAADVYVSTTSGEGWGLTVFEALNHGTPCLVPNNTSYAEYLPPFMLCDVIQCPIQFGRIDPKGSSSADRSLLVYGIRNGITKTKIVEGEELFRQYQNRTKECAVIKCTSTNFKQIMSSIASVPEFCIIGKLASMSETDSLVSEYRSIGTQTIHNYTLFVCSPIIFDSSIVKTGIVNTDLFAQKMQACCTNLQRCKKEVARHAPRILEKLSPSSIAQLFETQLRSLCK